MYPILATAAISEHVKLLNASCFLQAQPRLILCSANITNIFGSIINSMFLIIVHLFKIKKNQQQNKLQHSILFEFLAVGIT